MNTNTKFVVIKSLIRAFIMGVITVLITVGTYMLTKSIFISTFVFICILIGAVDTIVLLANKLMEESKHD